MNAVTTRSRRPGPDAGGRPAPETRAALRAVMRAGAPVVAVATVLALGLPRLGRRPIWLDEAYTVGTTHELVATWRGTGGTMAAYYLLVWPVAQLSTERMWVRLPSLLCAAAAVVVVHQVGRLVGGRRTAAFAAGTLAVSWSLSRFALEARSYTLALLLVALAWWGLVGAVRAEADAAGAGAVGGDDGAGDDGAVGGGAGALRAGRRWWWLFVAATVLAPLAHGLAAAHLAGQVAVLAVAPDRRRWLRRCVPVVGVLAVEGFALFAIGAGEVAGWIDPLNMSQVRSFLHVLVGRGPVLWTVGPLALAGLVLAVLGLRPGARTRAGGLPVDAWARLVPVAWALGAPLLVLALSTVRPYAESRYVLGALPGVALLAGAALARIRPAGLAVAAWVVVAAASLADQPRVTTVAIEDWPALADHLAAHAEPGDRVLTPSKLRAALDYAWAEDAGRPELAALSPSGRVGEVRRFYDPAPGTMRSRLLADPTETVWYVDRDRSRLDEVEALVADPEVGRHYTAERPRVFDGELYLVRFEPRR